MKITDIVKSTPPVAPTQTSSAGARGAEKAAANPGLSGNVSLSSQGQAMAASAVGGSAVFDTQKVERIKLSIAGGQFQVNSAKVADGLLGSAKDFLSARKQ